MTSDGSSEATSAPDEVVSENGSEPVATVAPRNAAAPRALRIFALVAFATVVADQLAKMWIRSWLPLGSEHEVVPGVFSLSHILNHGAAWGMLSGQRWFLIGITLFVMLVVAQMARELAPESALARLGLGLILGGAIGNLIDRIMAGAVTDFIDLGTSIEFIRTFPVFNIADSALTVGVILLIFDILLNRRLKFD